MKFDFLINSLFYKNKENIHLI